MSAAHAPEPRRAPEARPNLQLVETARRPRLRPECVPEPALPFRPRLSPIDGPAGGLLGVGVAVGLFFLVAFAQMMGDVVRPSYEIEEVTLALDVPEVEEVQEEEEAPPPEAEAEPAEDLALEPPRLTLDQLDIALNPGVGGTGLVGDFALPQLPVQRDAGELGSEEFVDFAELDQIPRPIGVAGFNFPRRLREKPVQGRIVLLLKLSEHGDVLEVAIDDSNLPAFDDFVLSEVRRWRFTPPTRRGVPVRAKARLPIPIRIG